MFVWFQARFGAKVPASLARSPIIWAQQGCPVNFWPAASITHFWLIVDPNNTRDAYNHENIFLIFWFPWYTKYAICTHGLGLFFHRCSQKTTTDVCKKNAPCHKTASINKIPPSPPEGKVVWCVQGMGAQTGGVYFAKLNHSAPTTLPSGGEGGILLTNSLFWKGGEFL